MAYRILVTSVFFGTIVFSLNYPCNSTPMDGYAFPVFTTESCPRNLTERQERSSALNCTQEYTYLCVPDINITQLLEFCYSLPQIQIFKGFCMLLNKTHSIVDVYDCSHFTTGCPNSTYESQEVYKFIYKRKQTLDSHEEDIPLNEIERISWNQPISSPTLETLFGFIGDVILHLSPDTSFAYELLTVAKISEFINEINMLSRGVELYRKIDTENHTHQPGKVLVFEVKLRCQENELTVIPENPNNWNAFLSANSEYLIKVMNIESRSLHVIPAKLRVYREFKDGIDTGDIFLHHVLEDYDEIAKRSAYKKISSFCDTTLFLKELSQEVLSHIPTILGNAFMHALTKEKISSISDNISLEYDGNKIGTRHSSPYECDSNIAKKIKGLLEEKIMLMITESLSFSICVEIEKHLKSHFGSDQKRIDFVKFKELQPFYKLVKYTLELTFSKVMSSENQLSDDDEPLSDDPSITSASSHLLKGATCNVNSITWRADVGGNIFHKIYSVKDNIISSTEDKIKEICRKTTEELQITHDRLRNFQDEIEIENQTKLVETWQKQEVVKDKKSLANHPSILNFIAGTKYGLPFIKVLLRHDDESDRLYIRNQSTHSEDTQFEFVDISAKSMELVQMQDKDDEIPLSDDIRSELNNIINSEAEKIYANYSIVSGLGVDNVRYDGNESVNEPCIVIYCLDKFLLPYGEKMLPTSLGGYPCDIREGVFMFGNCADCRHEDPDPGCSICRQDRIDTGSAGFLVRSTASKKDTGFLTAAHVAIEDIAHLYDEKVYLSRCRHDLKAKRHDVIHLSKSRGSSCAGKVKNSFIGNYLKIGIDAAYVKSYKQRLGETTEMKIADDSELWLEEKTKVRKKGQATGLTNGLLLKNNLYATINITDTRRFPDGYFVFNNCYAITDEDPRHTFFKNGDSGSGVYLTDNDKPLGIAFAMGYRVTNGRYENITVVCRINSFIEECKVTIHNEQMRMEY